jgi:broad specificity phosphatase PhoE
VDEGLEEFARGRLGALRGRLPTGHTAVTGAALRCRQTAEALGLTANVEAALADWDLGSWAGKSLDDLAVNHPIDVHTWMSDPDAAPHGGESLNTVLRRVGDWLDDPDPERPTRLLAVTHPAVIRAAVVHALQAEARSFWRIDVPPLTVAEVRGKPGRWAHYLRD